MPKVFFSWQSDHPSSLCKRLIRSALDSAAKNLNSTVSEADRTEIVSDTQGIAGSPDIFNAICDQIDQCDVFVADLTMVAEIKQGDKRKVLPNPNVSIEYGYALKSKSRQRIVAVMNEAYFEPKIEELPFNLRHARGPYRYKAGPLEKGVQLENAEKKLAQFFTEAIGSILKLPQNQSSDQLFVGQTPLETDPSVFLRPGEVITRDGDFSGQSLKVVLGANKGNIYARLIPTRELTMGTGVIRQRMVGAPGLSIATASSNGSYGNNQFGYANYAILGETSGPRRTVLDFVQFFKSGEVWCINGSAFSHYDDVWEGTLFKIINRMLEVFKDWLKRDSSNNEYRLVVGVTRLKDKRIAYGLTSSERSTQFYIDNVEVELKYSTALTIQNVRDILRKKIEEEL